MNNPIPRPEPRDLDYCPEDLTLAEEFAALGDSFRALWKAINESFGFERKLIWMLDKLSAGLNWIKSKW